MHLRFVINTYFKAVKNKIFGNSCIGFGNNLYQHIVLFKIIFDFRIKIFVVEK